ncbi:hypothetical protein [Pyxidicoccus caerfyrddinensis]|uniref:hypothetical protein n=1 Tax=Pyxidicoccus caerfyrddinensis TaxID=2709663 RepID=UPI0013DA0F45|nr:hypothetical protein [Pyxidicoccus caerfyrddinensis]
MTKTHVLVAVVLSALTACGGDENDDGNPTPPAETDSRPNMTGSYAVSGTMTVSGNGSSDTTQVRDTVRIANDTTSTSKAALRLDVASLGCGPRARMSAEKAFTVASTSCPLPPENGCTYTLEYSKGNGHRDGNGTLFVTLQGQLTARCGGGTAAAAISMELTGSRTGQSRPGTREDALTGTAPTSLRATMDRLALSAPH